jgi:hypothetical protein
LIVGLAESGADIRDISDVALEATLCITSYSWLLPRCHGGKVTTDYHTTRLEHYKGYWGIVKEEMPFVHHLSSFFAKMVFLTFIFLCHVFAKIFGPTFHLPVRETNPLGDPMFPLKLDTNCELNDANLRAIEQ